MCLMNTYAKFLHSFVRFFTNSLCFNRTTDSKAFVKSRLSLLVIFYTNLCCAISQFKKQDIAKVINNEHRVLTGKKIPVHYIGETVLKYVCLSASSPVNIV